MADQKDVDERWWITSRADYLPQPIHLAAQHAALRADHHARRNVEIAATSAIFAALSKWTGHLCRPGAPVPIVRDGNIVGEYQGTVGNALMGITCPAASILFQAHIPSVQDLKSQRQEVAALLRMLDETLESMRMLSLPSWLGISKTWDQRDGPPDKDADIVHAVGLQEAANISIHGLAVNCRRQLRLIDWQLQGLDGRRGRPKDMAAHRVAEHYGKLYAKVTGRRPTYGEGPDGLAGEFTPALRDLFDALGWEAKSLRGPATTAISAVADEFDRSTRPSKEDNGVFGLLPALADRLRGR